MEIFDFVIIWAWFYWMHAARYLWNKWFNVCILEKEWDALTKASYINQARVHNWYHYPRSYQTAIKTKEFFNRFVNDFWFAINKDFNKIYAIASEWSKTNASEFELFCEKVWIPYEEIDHTQFFKDWKVEKAYLTKEYVFDAIKIRDFMKEEIWRRSNIKSYYYYNVNKIEKTEDWILISSSNNNKKILTKKVINSTYAWINEIHHLLWIEDIDIKYEFTEMVLCDVSENIRNYWITVMDWDYFSVMPFWIWWKFSVSHVKYTPHEESFESTPDFECLKNDYWIPKSNFDKMMVDFKEYMKDDIQIQYDKSLFTTKVVLSSSERDDSRPTFLRRYDLWNNCDLITIFSWKINTIYEIEDFLESNSDLLQN